MKTRRKRNTRKFEMNSISVSPVYPILSISNDFFIDLGRTHILNKPLEQVISKTWLHNDGCDIFIIGEEHGIRNGKCNGIYDMFVDIIHEINRSDIKPNIDIMIEITASQVSDMKDSLSADLSKRANILRRKLTDMRQLNMIRKLFVNCIKYKHCPMKAHWIDSNMNKSKRLPPWINELYNAHLNEKDWSQTPSISAELTNKRSLLKLLTSNGIVTKEIEKAEKINPTFTLKFAESLFAKMIVDYSSKYSKETTVFHSFRAIMDFYTVARIIKSEMKHVIVYVGNNHAERISHILQQLGFELREKATNPQCVILGREKN